MTKTPTRLYVVGKGDTARLVRAHHPDVALRHVAKEMTVRVATQDDLVLLIEKGVKPELARPENGELALAEPQD